MCDLYVFVNDSFDVVFYLIFNLYVFDVCLVWIECCCVLVCDGMLMVSFYNLVLFVGVCDL